MFRYLAFTLACCCTLAVTAFAQTKTRLLITDEFDGVVQNKVDYMVVPPETTEAVLLRLGYDDASISKAQSNKNRRISISMEEISDAAVGSSSARPASIFGNKATVIDGNQASVQETSRTRTRVVEAPKANDLLLEDFVNIPKGATVEDMPDGSKRITTYRTNKKGEKEVDKVTTVKRVKNGDEHTTEWEENQSSGTPTLSESHIVIPANTNRSKYTETYDGSQLNLPDVVVTTDEPDMFDNSVLMKKKPALLNAPSLALKEYAFGPDLKNGFFKLSFGTENASKPTEIYLLDVVGALVYTETISDFSGNYSKLIPDFSVYKKGTFLLLITQDGAKFTRRIEID